MASLKGAVRAADHFFGYRFHPLDGGKRCRAILVCQTSLRGWMPSRLVNASVSKVLADYMRTLEVRSDGASACPPGGSTVVLRLRTTDPPAPPPLPSIHNHAPVQGVAKLMLNEGTAEKFVANFSGLQLPL